MWRTPNLHNCCTELLHEELLGVGEVQFVHVRLLLLTGRPGSKGSANSIRDDKHKKSVFL